MSATEALPPSRHVREHVHEHRHDHDRSDASTPVISRRWKWAAVLGNAAIGTAELATGNLSTISVTADGIHNAGDAATYYMQAESVLNRHMSPRRRQRMRKAAYWIIGASSAAIAAKAGYDIAADHQGGHSVAATYAAGASLALNGFLYGIFRRNQQRRGTGHHHDAGEHDIAKHFLKVDVPSAAAALGGALLQKYSISAEQWLAMGAGLFSAWSFRPTKQNLEHDCLGDGHGHSPAVVVPDQAAMPAADPHRPLIDWEDFEARLSGLEARLFIAEARTSMILR